MNVFLHTFGCRANQYDTELVRQAFADRGASIVDDPSAADVAVVNSCTVTAESEVKLRRFVRRLAQRPDGRSLDTVVMGCAAARDDGTLRALPSVRAVIGGADPATVLSAAGFAARRTDPVLRRFGTNGRGWLKIQDGCDEHCSFCATTLARGANRSRAIPELIEEAKALSAHHSEIVLTGIHIGTYGEEGRGKGEGSALGELLESLISAVPEVRFRLSSIEATEVDDRIARLLIEEPRRLAPYLHAPLQAGSNRVLRRMGRHWYTAESYRTRLEWLAARLPVFGLGADVIAGFPGETEADHQATLDLIRALPFTSLHVFPYSPRPDTAATRLQDAVPSGAIRVRAAQLRTLGEEKALAYRASRTGATGDGVVCGRIAGQVDVLTEDYLSIHVPVEHWDGRRRFPIQVA